MHGYKPLGRNYPETSIGWYRRAFEIPRAMRADASRSSSMAPFAACSSSSMAATLAATTMATPFPFRPFGLPLTGGKNYIVARVDASYGDGWYYEGAGVYRHVWLTKTDALHLGRWESTVRPPGAATSATLSLATVVENESNQP